MLPAQHRLTRGEELRRVSRAGRRSGCPTLVVHLVAPEAPRPPFDTHEVSPRVGFVVGRAVGNSVLRHRVLRRLRHLCRDRLSILPGGAELVVRALAPAGAASYQELGADLDRCLERALADHGPGPGTVS